MTDAFWDPIYKKCQNNYELLELICYDTSDKVMVGWVRPNIKLLKLCKPYFHNKKIVKKAPFIKALIEYSEKDEALRKIIFLTWLQNNSNVMKFPTLAIDNDSLEKLASGNFGNAKKIEILSFIDPREGAHNTYEEFLKNSALEKNEEVEVVDIDIEKNKELCSVSLALSNSKEDLARLNKKQITLEKEIKSLRLELKKITKELKNKTENEKNAMRIVTQKSHLLKDAEAGIEKLKRINSGLDLKLNAALNEIENISAISNNKHNCKDVVENSGSTSLQNEKNKLKVITLQKALRNRDKTIARLNEDNEKLKGMVTSDKEKDQRIARLQKLLKLRSENSEFTKIYGQLKSIYSSETNKQTWFFYSFSGSVYRVGGKVVRTAGVIDSEFCMLTLIKGKEKALELSSLEPLSKQEIIGFLSNQAGQYVISDNNIETEVNYLNTKANLESPVKGIYLPTFGDRKEGIFSVKTLKTFDNLNAEVKVATLADILKVLKVRINGQSAEFAQLLINLNVEHYVNTKGEFVFEKDYRKLFHGLRGKLPIHTICKACIAKGNSQKFLLMKLPTPNHLCEICYSKDIVSSSEKAIYNFNESKIIILGGDYVGNLYETNLGKHNLKVRWFSGFNNLNSLRSGLGKIDAVVIILRQLSHTVLREAIPLAEAENIPVIYCAQRGISGVLECLKKSLPYKLS